MSQWLIVFDPDDGNKIVNIFEDPGWNHHDRLFGGRYSLSKHEEKELPAIGDIFVDPRPRETKKEEKILRKGGRKLLRAFMKFDAGEITEAEVKAEFQKVLSKITE